MSETKAAPQSDATSAPQSAPVPGNIVSAGRPEPVKLTIPAKAPEVVTETIVEEKKPPEISDEQLKEILKGRGIELDDTGFDGLKEKIKPAIIERAPEDVEAEKAKAEAAFEKRMVDYFMEHGGTVEQFANLKAVASADLKSLSESEIRRELKEAEFSDDEIQAIMVERYYQINPEELTQADDETTAEFEKRKAQVEKKIAYGAKKFESKSSYIKKQAEDALGTLRNAIKEEDLRKDNEVKISSMVDDLATKLPRKLTIELGMANNQQIAPVVYNVSEADIADVISTLKDSEKRNNFLYNSDDSLNLENLANVMLRNKYLESALKVSYLEGGNRQVEAFEKLFPGRTAKEIGVGGVTGGGNQNRKGHIVSRGASEPVRR